MKLSQIGAIITFASCYAMHDEQKLIVKQAFTWDTSTPWAVLHSAPSSDPQEIKNNWKKLAQVWHPDRNKEIKSFADEVFKAVLNAYDTVNNNQEWNPDILNQSIITSVTKVKENQTRILAIIPPLPEHSYLLNAIYRYFKLFRQCSIGTIK